VKISFISTFFPYRGGIAHFNALLYKQLTSRNHHVEAINFSRQYPSLLFPGKSQEEQNQSSQADFQIPNKRILDSINPFSWLRVGLKVRASNPDFLLFRYWLSFFAPAYFVICAVSKVFRKTKVIYIVDNLHPHEKRPGDSFLLWLATRLADGYITLSSKVEQDLKSYIPNAICFKAPHPVYNIFGEVISKTEARKLLKLELQKPVILFFGYIRAYKGLDILLKAIPKIIDKLPDATFLIAGEFYSNEAQYKALIEELSIQDVVQLHNNYIPNNEVTQYFCASDCVVLPYKSATQSGIVQIAYNFNTPAIVTNVGGLAEIVQHEKTGLLVENGNPDSLAEAVINFYNNYNTQDFISEIEREKKKYSWGYFTDQLENLMQELSC